MKENACIKIGKNLERLVSQFKCIACNGEFVYMGYPDFCPECGTEFTLLKDQTDALAKEGL